MQLAGERFNINEQAVTIKGIACSPVLKVPAVSRFIALIAAFEDIMAVNYSEISTIWRLA